jgi:hypothetical protein
MKIKIAFASMIASLLLLSCEEKKDTAVATSSSASIVGTWQLITGTLIEKGDTVVTDYSKNVSFIKIINDTHFAFLQHDLRKGKDSAASFTAGGGRYTLKDSSYTEHLEYCNAREWEGNDFTFNVSLSNDTLVQSGVEKIDSAGINRINIEKYFRVKQ